MKFFRKLLVKNYQHTELPEVRFRYGYAAAGVGIGLNIVLFALKLTVGLLSGSLAVIADAINNVSDAGSSVVTLFGFKLSARPADKEHPFGHARYENIAALIVAIVVMAIGIMLAKDSIGKIITPTPVNPDVFTYVVLGASIGVKLFMMLLYLDFAKTISSDSLKASAMDSRNDILSTTMTLVATLIIAYVAVPQKISVDGIFGLAVSVFIIISTLKLIRETIDPLLGTVPDPRLVDQIKDKIMSYKGVLGMHDLAIHNYGAANCFVIVHVEVDAHEDIMKSHDVIDNIERDFKEQLGINMNIHMDPVDTDDDELNDAKERIKVVLAEMNSEISSHDFRIVRGDTHSNILFDVVVPFDCKITRKDIEERLNDEYKDSKHKYYFVIEIDRSRVL